MKYSDFHLENTYNSSEGLFDSSISSGILPPLSLNDFIDNEALKELLELKLDYSEQYGLKALREVLCDLYKVPLAPYNFLVTSGASEAIFLVMSTLFKAGDTIIVQKPIYQSLYQIAQDQGVNIISWNYDAFKSFEENVEGLRALVSTERERLKALVLNNPNNPLGVVFDQEQMLMISDLLNNSGTKPYLICDEVFRDLSDAPSYVDVYDNAIAISDMSKSYALPGLRIGWIACRDTELLETFSAQKNYLSLRSSTLSEHVALYALNERDDILKRHQSLIQKNSDELRSLNPNDLPFILPEEFYIKPEQFAGLCLFPKTKKGFDFVDKDCFILKGDVFGDEYKSHFRLGLAHDIAINTYKKLV